MTDAQPPRFPAELDRYSRQMLFDPIGVEGQKRLAAARAVLVGVGALGTVQANSLVRAGVGHLKIIDRDFIETNNLQRQTLFDEQDIADNLPKAEAAGRKLARINSAVTVEAVVADVNHANIEQLADGADILLDGTDNFDARYLINDLAVKTQRPWVYGAAVGATGLVKAVLPGQTACIRCMFEDRPPAEANPTCDTAGVLGPVVHMVADLQALEAIKILAGHPEAVCPKLTHIDGWAGRIAQLDVGGPRADCPACGRKQFDFLSGKFGSAAVSLCGRNAVQVAAPAGAGRVDFEQIADRLRAVAEPVFNRFMLKFTAAGHEVTVFADGRAIIKGTDDPTAARALYAKYVGS